MAFVYVLRNSSTGKLYIGSCEDLRRRLKEHRSKKKGYEVIYTEERPSAADALKREMYFKTGNGRRALKNLLPDS